MSQQDDLGAAGAPLQLSSDPSSLGEAAASSPCTVTIDAAELAELRNELAWARARLRASGMGSTPPVFDSGESVKDVISVFTGDIRAESAVDWLREVEHVASLALWEPGFKMAVAFSHLKGSALNWNRTDGKDSTDWDSWKAAISTRFRCRINLAEFWAIQAKRVLRDDETITEYAYSKNALLEKAPYKLSQPERVSLIVDGITDMSLCLPLALAECATVSDLLDRIYRLETCRNVKPKADARSKPSRQTTSCKRRRAPLLDPSTACFRCGHYGHNHKSCSLPAPPRRTPIAVPVGPPPPPSQAASRND